LVQIGKETGGLKGKGAGAAKRVDSNSNQPSSGRVLPQIAKAAGVGVETVHRVEKLIEKAPAPVIEKLRKGEVSINEAYTSLKYAEKEAQRDAAIAEFPTIQSPGTATASGRKIRVNTHPIC
jgi:hypothetical protein